MKYNCLRIHPYAKMLVVGLLLYFGETVFFKCSEEGTFIVKVKNHHTGLFIDVHNCKGTDMLSEFMKKFEKAYDENSTNEKIKDIPYNLIYNGSSIVKDRKPIEDKSLTDLGINAKTILHFVLFLKKAEDDIKPINLKIFKGNEDEVLRNIDEKIININSLESFENLPHSYTAEKKEDPSTSTCPLRRCCRICGC